MTLLSVVTAVGKSSEWWRNVNHAYLAELEHNLINEPSFAPFLAEESAPQINIYYAYCQHYSLCRHSELDCQFFRALAFYYSFKGSKKTLVNYPSVPTSSDPKKSAWEEFSVTMEGIAEKKGMDIEGTRMVSVETKEHESSSRRGEQRSRQISNDSSEEFRLSELKVGKKKKKRNLLEKEEESMISEGVGQSKKERKGNKRMKLGLQ